MNILHYLNPIERFGNKKYSFLFPFFTNVISAILVDILFIVILKNPAAIGIPAIALFVIFIIYFSFRDGILGGLISVTVTVFFYLYIVFAEDYKNQQFISGIETTVILGTIYLILALVIGWLKQTIDNLLERESDARRRLEAIVEQLPIGIIITDKVGKIMEANRQIDKILGLKVPVGHQVGKDMPLIESKTNKKIVSEKDSPLYLAIKSGLVTESKEYVFQRRDGKNIFIQINAKPIKNKNGTIIAAVSTILDITAQKEQEERKDDFVNMASHELKTPLTTMKIYSDLLMRQVKNYDKQDRKIVQNIELQIQRLQQIVNDLLDVSRLQTGKLSLSKERFYLDELLEAICEDLQPSSKQKLKIMKKIKLPIVADKFRIYQVLTNIITNAIKYSPETKEIRIRLEKKNNTAVISVEDFGIGIAKSQHKKIFQRLYQVREAKGETYPGFGMGLYISKEIIQRHKGKIWVESKPGKGTIFFLRLPLIKT